MSEAKHPLIQDLIKLWEESPGYILPQESFIQDKAKLEKLIDNLIEANRQKELNAVAPLPKAPARVITKTENPTVGEDPNWEKNLARALSSAKVQPGKSPLATAPLALPALVDLKKIPGAEEKLAQLQLAKELPLPVSEASGKSMQTGGQRLAHLHLIILYTLSGTAFVLACIAIAHRFK